MFWEISMLALLLVGVRDILELFPPAIMIVAVLDNKSDMYLKSFVDSFFNFVKIEFEVGIEFYSFVLLF